MRRQRLCSQALSGSRALRVAITLLVLLPMAPLVAPSPGRAATPATAFDFPVNPPDGGTRSPWYATYGARNPYLTDVAGCYGKPYNALYHTGEDWYRPAGASVYAVANGRVIYAQNANYPGAVVIIEHDLGNGWTTPWGNAKIFSMYGHLSTSGLIGAETDVAKGQRIGSILDQGSNSRVHFEMRRYGDMTSILRCPVSEATSWSGPGYTENHPDNWGYTSPSGWIDGHRSGSGSGGGASCPAPSLNVPAEGETLRSLSYRFTWNDVSCAHNGFTFRIQTDANIADLNGSVIDTGAGSTFWDATIPSNYAGRDLYWGVRAANAQSASWSPARRFRIDVSQPPPPSCNPTADQVALYVDPNHTGQCVVKEIGNYPNPSSIGLPNDAVSSVRVGTNVKAVLCRNDNYDSCEWLDHDDGNLSDNSVGDETVSSLRVESRIPSPPGKPHDPSPASGSILSYRSSLDFTWQGEGDQFQVHVWSTDGQLNWPAKWQSGRTLHLDHLAAGSYLWQVEAKNAGGSSGWTSPAWSFTIQPPQVTCDNAYRTEYFNNETVSGAPAYIDCTTWPIDKAWQNDSPAPGVRADHFSVRWTADINITSGVYRFYARGDDGIRVYFDGSRIIDQWEGNQPERTYDVNVSTGFHHVIVEYREIEGSASARFGWNTRFSDTVPPTAFWVAPTDGHTIAARTVTLQANATDATGEVQRVEFSAKWDGVWRQLAVVRSGTPYSYTWDLCAAGVPDGDVELGLKAYDLAGNEFVYSQTRTNYHITKAYTCNPTNRPPIANAGPDQTVSDDDGDGLASVRLDGSGSSDPDGSIDAYSWSENGQILATGRTPTVVLAIGAHTLQLIVTDSSQATSRDTVTITVQPQPVDPDDNRTLTAGTPLTGTIAPMADQDSYWFNAVAGQVVTLTATKTTGSQLDGHLTLYAPDGSRLATDNDGGGSQNPLINRLTLTVTGQYRVVVTSFASFSSGSYSLQLTLTSTAPAACATIPADAYCAEYFPNETLSGGALVAVADTAPLSHEWWTGNPGNGIAEDHFSVRWRGNFTFVDGLYLFSGLTDDGVRISIDGEVIGEDWTPHRSLYQFASPITAGQHEVTVEYYEQDGVAGISLDWRLDQPPVASAGPDQTITDDGDGVSVVDLNGSGSYDPDGTLTAYTWSLDGAGIANGVTTTAILPAGTHTITLTVTDDRGQAATDDVIITVNLAPIDPDDGRTLTVAQPLTGTISPATDQDDYWFDGVQGQQATVQLTAGGDSELDAYLHLYSPTDMLLAEDDDGAGAPNPRITLALPATGRYHVVASSLDQGSDGAYTIALTLETPPASCATIPKDGYCAEYFSSDDLSGNAEAVVQENAPLNHDWGQSGPGHGIGVDHFSARWQGRFDFSEGMYAFSVRADDGIRIWVDETLIQDNSQRHGVDYQFDRAISGGEHRITVEYFEYDGAAMVGLSWQRQQPRDPVVTLSSPRVTTNAQVSYDLSWFPASRPVTISWLRAGGGTVDLGAVTTDGAGTANGNFRAPTVEGGAGHLVRFTSGNVTTSVPIEIAPRIKVVPSDVAPGEAVDIWLRGFAKDETVRVRWKDGGGNWVEIARATTSGSGSATFHLTVPGWVVGGDNSVRGDGTSFRAQTNAVSVTIPPPPAHPAASLSTYRTTTNARVTYTLSDFPAARTVTVTWIRASGGTVDLGSTTMDSGGAGSGSFRVPTSAGGPGTRVRFSSGATTVDVEFEVAPRIKVVPSDVTPGQAVDIWLRGFARYETVRVRWRNVDGSWIEIARATTSGTGSATFHLTVPDWVANGPNSVRGDGTDFRAQTNAVIVSGAVNAADAPAATPTPSPSPTAIATSTPTTPTPEPTVAPIPEESPAPIVEPTTSPTPELTPTAEPTITPEPTATPTPDTTEVPTDTPATVSTDEASESASS